MTWKRRIGVAAVAVALLSHPASADEVRPIQIQIREREPGAFLVQWRVPQLLPIQAMPSPVLPEECVAEGERILLTQPGSWVNQQAYRCEGGLSGKAVGIHYPIRIPQYTTVIRVELLSGDRFAHAFPPTEESWIVPNLEAGSIEVWLNGAGAAVTRGGTHILGHSVHLTFLLALCLLGGLVGSTRLAMAFAAGQIVAVLVTLGVGGGVGPLVPETCAAIALVFLALEILRNGSTGASPARRVLGLSGGAGLFHGLSLASVVPGVGPDGALWSYLLLLVLGMDAALLVSSLALNRLSELVDRKWKPAWLRTALSYGIGGIGVAAVLVLATERPTQGQTSPTAGERLPGIGAMASTSAAPSSRRVAPQVSEAPVQSFLAIQPFEIRHEVLVRLADVAGLMGVGGTVAVLPVETQAEIAERVGEFVVSQVSLTVDGEPATGTLDRVDYLTVDLMGVLPRPSPVPEPVEDAMIGVTLIHLTPGVPDEVTVRWAGFSEEVPSVPATFIDPESSNSVMLQPERASGRWENRLMDDPIPTVESMAVEPPKLPVPLFSLLLLLIAVILGVVAVRGRLPELSLVGTRVTLAAAFVAAPFAQASVTLPFDFGSVPSERAARRVLAGVMPNVYRAFEFRDEAMVYDRLALTVTGETLTDAYLEHRRAMVMEERGGARARVEAVEVIEVRDVVPGDGGGFDARVAWTVGGTVTHFGHRHFRQNRYDVRVSLVPVEGTWKIRTIEVLEEERVR
jgi:hypothetical protein